MLAEAAVWYCCLRCRLREPEAVSLNELVESGQERQLSQLTAAATREGASKSTCSTMCGRCGAPDWCLPHWAGPPLLGGGAAAAAGGAGAAAHRLPLGC
jgi:hypothetical protein